MLFRPLLFSLCISLCSVAVSEAAPRARAAGNVVAPRAKAIAKAKPVAKTRVATAKLAGSIHASPAKAIANTKKLASAYATGHSYPTRSVEVGLEGHKIERVFVPILPDSIGTFYASFAASAGKESVVLRYTEANKHLILSMEPSDIYLWGQNKNVDNEGNDLYKRMYHNLDGAAREWKGVSIVVHPTNIGALRTWLGETAKGPKCEGHCMMWLPNAPTGSNTTLFHDLGITRSADGANMRNKIMHAGNHRVGVVGIHVNSVAEFEQMTEAQLVGSLPTNGLEGAVRK